MTRMPQGKTGKKQPATHGTLGWQTVSNSQRWIPQIPLSQVFNRVKQKWRPSRGCISEKRQKLSFFSISSHLHQLCGLRLLEAVRENEKEPALWCLWWELGSTRVSPWLSPMQESRSTCKQRLPACLSAPHANAPHIRAQNIAWSIFPPSTLNRLEHKSLREGDLPDKSAFELLGRVDLEEDGRDPSAPIISTCTN